MRRVGHDVGFGRALYFADVDPIFFSHIFARFGILFRLPAEQRTQLLYKNIIYWSTKHHDSPSWEIRQLKEEGWIGVLWRWFEGYRLQLETIQYIELYKKKKKKKKQNRKTSSEEEGACNMQN